MTSEIEKLKKRIIELERQIDGYKVTVEQYRNIIRDKTGLCPWCFKPILETYRKRSTLFKETTRPDIILPACCYMTLMRDNKSFT